MNYENCGLLGVELGASKREVTEAYTNLVEQCSLKNQTDSESQEVYQQITIAYKHLMESFTKSSGTANYGTMRENVISKESRDYSLAIPPEYQGREEPFGVQSQEQSEHEDLQQRTECSCISCLKMALFWCLSFLHPDFDLSD